MSDDAIPEFIPVISRTTSDEMTRPMRMLDHRCARQDGPPAVPPDFMFEEDTNVDAAIVDVEDPPRLAKR